MEPLVRVRQVEKYYGTSQNNLTKALDGVSFDVLPGDFIGIMGSSGSGKSTLLNCIATIDEVSAGQIILNQTDLRTLSKKAITAFRQENLGFIFQDYNLLDTLKLTENIALPLIVQKRPHKEIQRRVQELAEQLGIEDVLEKYPSEVSGGQKQRAACARALIANPKLVVADEPTGALDSKSSQTLMKTLQELNQLLQTTILVVTHDPFVASYCKKIFFLEDGRLFNELHAGGRSRPDFYQEILGVLSVIGGV
ncbi:ABC transporter ATP-binding protein [Enterococcus sp. 669A]|uniref:ABC transporter ATP-binding protein n=1 Tax=Candidatus Enterococcus moelleringii TaxID=2815325 RepID=A0ABS3L7S5_9ENTE|nr:ABC transporter ATP-binding protein [Enterococcus sp. 669A]MBO1305677.1 ABC transporter ATP-binding protein [Enterococcus sp. 669A]